MIEGGSFSSGEGGVRLDAALLVAFPGSSRAFVRDAIASGNVKVCGAVCRSKGLKLRRGDVVSVAKLLEKSDNTVRPDLFFRPRCVFEDDALLAFDKPPDMSVHPLGCEETGTLMNAVAALHPECIPVGDKPLMAGALHRIDAGTSGLVLVARTGEAFAAMRAQFAAQTVKKTYLALVEGSVAVGGVLEHDLVHAAHLPYCKMVPGRGYRAVTRYKPVGRASFANEERTLLEVEIFTGVTHQIRAQLAIAGMHIVNDTLYGAFPCEGMRGHCLHALSAAFLHPSTSQPTVIATPFPPWAAAI